MKYAFIKTNRQIFTISSMCKVLDIVPSSYYNWINRGISDQQIHRNQCELLVRVAHSETKQRYDVDRLHAHLAEQGYHISQYMVRRIKESDASNAVVTSTLKSLLTLIMITWSIQTCSIRNLILITLTNLGSVTSFIHGQMRVGYT